MPKQSIVRAGDRDFVIMEKPLGLTTAWRKRLRESTVMAVFESLDDAINQVINVGTLLTEGKKLSDIDLAPVIASTRIIPIFVRGLSNSIDEVIDLVYDYCSMTPEDKEWLDENAYTEEIVQMFLEILKFSFPIMALWDMVRGSRVQQTSTKSHAQNGVSGLPASGPVKKKR